MYVKRVSLTSKKNWWMVEVDQEEKNMGPALLSTSVDSFSSSEDTAVAPDNGHYEPETEVDHAFPNTSLPVYKPPRHPTAIFSFPTPTAYSAPPNPTASLAPCAQGSASELFKCVVKKPDVIQLEINGEIQSNASDVTTQFLAELRVYTTVARHRNIAAFLGCLENVGMVLEYVDGRTLYAVIRAAAAAAPLTRAKKVDIHNQLLAGLTHLHSYGLSHGDLSLLNVQLTWSSDTIKLLDFGRSVARDSVIIAPSDEPADPWQHLLGRKTTGGGGGSDHHHQHQHQHHGKAAQQQQRRVEQIHPGTRPFAAPEVLREECEDPLLADAYSFGMVLVCVGRCEVVDVQPWEQRRDVVPDGLFAGCEVFEERAREYLRRWDSRRRLCKEDAFPVDA